MPSLQVGQEVELIGTWQLHKKFGRQFHAVRCTFKLPTTLVGLKKYLGSGLIKGIGKSYAEKLVDRFGNSILHVIEHEPERLKEVGGIGPQRIKQITEAWVTHKDVAELMVFLQDKNISTTYAAKIYKRYQQNSLKVLQENPYRLAEDIWGIGFKKADEISLKMGLSLESPERVSAGIIFAITTATQYGHLYITLEDLRSKSIDLLELNNHTSKDLLIKNALHMLYQSDKIKLLTYKNIHYITLPKLYKTEQAVANRMLSIIEHSSPLNSKINIDNIYQELKSGESDNFIKSLISLNTEQQNGIITALKNKITVITGGPGTGKTTLIKKLLNILEESHIKYKLAAPTGRAAKRILEGTGRQAVTLHRLLEFDLSTMSFKYNETNTLELDILIIDEASMIDIFLAHSILKALNRNAHLLLIGDIDQLPSVGPGNFLRNSIDSGVVTCVRLKEIFRQAQDSMIVVNAHKINNGEFPTSVPINISNKRDFIYIKEEIPENIIKHLKQILFIELSKHNIAIEDSIVLVPMNKGMIGTFSLNQHLQEMLNPDKNITQIIRNGTLYKIGDKVMQIKNNYEKLVFNGDIGVIEYINQEEKITTVIYDKKSVVYEFNELDEIVLAYAISIHKSQGSEYPAVIVPIFMQHFTLLQRNLIYTAITRAKKLCIFIGQPKAIIMGIKNNKGIERITFLKEFLQKIDI